MAARHHEVEIAGSRRNDGDDPAGLAESPQPDLVRVDLGIGLEKANARQNVAGQGRETACGPVPARPADSAFIVGERRDALEREPATHHDGALRRFRTRLAVQTRQGRGHWDSFRYLLDPQLLADATKLVLANAGSAGIDAVTCAEVRARGWEFISELREKLKTGRYRPVPVRRVAIPKKDGSERRLGIPTVEDRVVQRALVFLLEPVYEQRFLPTSYGSRPGRKAVVCVAAVARACFRKRHVLEADIEKFFDSVNHRKLLGMLKEEIADPRIMRLVGDILRAGIFESRTGKTLPSAQGTPQGGPLSPLLANVYLHYALDLPFEEAQRTLEGVE